MLMKTVQCATERNNSLDSPVALPFIVVLVSCIDVSWEYSNFRNDFSSPNKALYGKRHKQLSAEEKKKRIGRIQYFPNVDRRKLNDFH